MADPHGPVVNYDDAEFEIDALRARLKAAERVVEAARDLEFGDDDGEKPVSLLQALAAYDALPKAGDKQ